jgi:RNA polymerase sigma factor (TIGR02999 family)
MIERLNEGDVRAREELFRAFAAELHSLALVEMRKQSPAHTLQATALVNEVYLRLFGHGPSGFVGKAHFLRAAAQAMRCVLTDHARAKLSLKRGGAAKQVHMDPEVTACVDGVESFLDFSEEIEALAKADPAMARAVEMRIFLGTRMEEIAETLGLPLRSFERRFAAAVALLVSRLT